MARIARSELATVMARAARRVGDPKQFARDLAAYLLEEHRTAELDSLLRDIQKQWAADGYVDVLARVARPLDKQVASDISGFYRSLYPKAEQVALTEVNDPSVLGGVSLEIAEQRLDLSIARRLRQFKQAINVKGS